MKPHCESVESIYRQQREFKLCHSKTFGLLFCGTEMFPSGDHASFLTLKEKFTPKCTVESYLVPLVSMESLLRFRRPQNISGASQQNSVAP